VTMVTIVNCMVVPWPKYHGSLTMHGCTMVQPHGSTIPKLPWLFYHVFFGRVISKKPYVPVYQDNFNYPVSRLPSRRPIWSIDTSSSTDDLWRAAWETGPQANSEIIDDPTVPVSGANLPRREWCILNRFCSGNGRCAASLHQ